LADFQAFEVAEREGWSNRDRASGYVDLFASASDQAIDSLLDAVDAGEGQKTLDLCCGQGNVSEVLASRGCEVFGLDFSPAMLELARCRVDQATFFEGDAQNLPFDDGNFDLVVSNFGVCHAADQPRVLSEARRVLRSGGRFAMTVWSGPDVSPCFQVVYGAVKAHGSSEVSAPPGPDFHQFANQEIANQLLSAAGFRGVEIEKVDCAWDLDAPDGLSKIFEQGTVRAAMLLANQPPENLAAMCGVSAYWTDRVFCI
jgi:ubiquinone/menaquinone biosynthesis C-methylase UbiE